MNYNPYVPPQAGPPQAAGLQPAGGPQPWEIGEVLTKAWEIYKANWGVLTGGLVVMWICSSAPGLVVNVATGVSQALTPGAAQSSPYTVATIGVGVIDQMINLFFTIGLYRMCLAGARGESPQFATLFSGGSRFLPYLGAMILMLFAVVLGFALLIVPGMIIAIGLWATPFFIADSELGPIEAIKASWEATKGQRMALFLFGLVGVLLQLGGVLACCVGMLATLPMFLIAQAIVFLRISGRGAAVVPPPQMGYGGPPPGYGGPPPGYGGPPPGAPPGGGGYGGPPGGGGYGGPPGGGYGGPPGGGYGGPPPGAPPGGYGPPGGGGFPPR